MRGNLIGPLLALFFGASLMAHPVVAAALEAPPAPAGEAEVRTTTFQLPTIRAELTRPLQAMAYGGAHAMDESDVAETRLALRRARRAIAFGILGLICGPTLILVGSILVLSVLWSLGGIVFVVWGAVWLSLAIPFLIGGLVTSGVAQATLDRAEEEQKDEFAPGRRLGPTPALLVPVLRF